MDKSFLLTVGITCLLMGMVYLFMKQKCVIYDDKISSLFSVVQTMAGELQQLKLQSAEPVTPPPKSRVPTIISVSDDSQSEDDSESDTESHADFVSEPTKLVVVKTEPEDTVINVVNMDDECSMRVDHSTWTTPPPRLNVVECMEVGYSTWSNPSPRVVECSIEDVVHQMLLDHNNVVECSMEDVVQQMMNEHRMLERPAAGNVVEYSMEDAIVEQVEVKVAETASNGYSTMTVKELKKLVSEKGGPYIKTKAELIFYLENTH